MGVILLAATLFGKYAAFAGPSYIISLLGLAALGVISYRAREKARGALARLERAAKPKAKKK